MYSLKMEGLEGRAKLVSKRIPEIGKTASGNYFLRWEEGMKLSDFIDYVTSMAK